MNAPLRFLSLAATLSLLGACQLEQSSDPNFRDELLVGAIAGSKYTELASPYQWAPGSVVTVSMMTPTGWSLPDPLLNLPLVTPPGGVSNSLDTALRAWTSLVNPDGPNPIVFQTVADNDPNAKVKIFWVNGNGSSTNFGASRPEYNLSTDPGHLQTGKISLYRTIDGNANWTTNRAALQHAFLHHIGHVLNIGNDPMEGASLMGARSLPVASDLASVAESRRFSTYTIQGVNYLYNGGYDRDSPYLPIFTTMTGNVRNTNPILGWEAALLAIKAGKKVYLEGVVGKPDYSTLPGKIFPLGATNGSLVYWNSNSPASYNNYFAGACEDVAQSAASGAAFSVLAPDAVHPIWSTGMLRGLYTSASNQLLWSMSAPTPCQFELGNYYNLFPN